MGFGTLTTKYKHRSMGYSEMLFHSMLDKPMQLRLISDFMPTASNTGRCLSRVAKLSKTKRIPDIMRHTLYNDLLKR